MLTPDQQPLKTIAPMLNNLGLQAEQIAEIVGCNKWVIMTIMDRLEASPQRIIAPRPFNDFTAVIALHLHHYGCSFSSIVDLLKSEGYQFEELQLMQVFWHRRLVPYTKNFFKTGHTVGNAVD